MRILIAIPVFNEIRYVGRVLDKVKQFHDQILLVDDGSTDGTSQYLASRDDVMLVQHDRNRGYGQSIIDAFDWAEARGYEWVITMDCDEQHEPEMIPRFVHCIHTDRFDLISGSRYMEARPDDDLPPSDRRSINATITRQINELFQLGITDAFCGFKAHRVSATQKLKLDETGYAFPMQLWPRAVGEGLRIAELPVRLIYNDPNRHFGGNLDDPENRLRHYLKVLDTEVARLRSPRPRAQQEVEACGCRG